MQQVRGGVIALSGPAPRGVDFGADGHAFLDGRQRRDLVNRQAGHRVIGIQNFSDLGVAGPDCAAVSDLAARLGVERSLVEH